MRYNWDKTWVEVRVGGGGIGGNGASAILILYFHFEFMRSFIFCTLCAIFFGLHFSLWYFWFKSLQKLFFESTGNIIEK